jgi:phosphoglycolate phosphatase-like HAD superfamily hydrolase
MEAVVQLPIGFTRGTLRFERTGITGSRDLPAARTIVETALKHLIILDLDGVITSEEAYWDCGGLTLHELLYSPYYWGLSADASYQPVTTAAQSRRLSRMVYPEQLIFSLKARALNSNWDNCYAMAFLYLVALLARLPHPASLLPFQPSSQDWLAALRSQIATSHLAQSWDLSQLHQNWSQLHPFDLPVFEGAIGLELLNRGDAYASEVLGLRVEGSFSRHGPFWRLCQDLLQEWLLGEQLYFQVYGRQPAQGGKSGCLFFEEPLLPPERVRETLAKLVQRGYTLGVASGRLWREAEPALRKYGFLPYFSEEHICTHDVVEQAEASLRRRGDQRLLSKPHPFPFLAAVDRPSALALSGGEEHPSWTSTPCIAVGDSTSDILAGRAAGALTVAVLTGARTAEARRLLEQSRLDFLLSDMTELPTLLEQIEGQTIDLRGAQLCQE